MTALVLVALVLLAAVPWALPARAASRSPARRVRPGTPAVPAEVDAAVLLDLADAALTAGASVPGTLQALGRALGDPAPAGRGRWPAGTRAQLERGAGGAPRRRHGASADGAGPALRQAGAALLLGASWSEAWEGAPPGLGPLAQALEPAWVDGAAPGPLLRRAAAAVRADRHRQAQEAAARLGVRLVLPLGLCFLPAFILLGVVPVVLAAGGGLLGS
ncbi:type II secretion system F family protein [Georgenia sp. AZ-5]|uniref:type II secretion system F family protein n=1 Tax=Georgenia sp. AZ-5 TaxID=3367526 RepID=UPI0037552959